jgi:hypothetical protein
MEKIENIPIRFSIEEIKGALRTQNAEQVQNLLDIALPLIRARAVYRVCFIEEKLENALVLERIRLTSQVLRKNLDEVGRVFPYVVTIGSELEERACGSKDLLENYYLDLIGNMALRKSRDYLEGHLRSRFALDGMSFMSPGSLPDWPIEEQRQLFSILQGVEQSIGVRLNESLLMIPRKSVSGIYFPTEIKFYSCQLCPREICEGRKAPYDEALARKMLQSKL